MRETGISASRAVNLMVQREQTNLQWHPRRMPKEKMPPEGGILVERAAPGSLAPRLARCPIDHLLAAAAAALAAAVAAAAAALAAAATPEAAVAAAPATPEAAASTAEAAAAGAGAGAAAGAGAGAGASFLPQAVMAAAAISEANRSDLFIYVSSVKSVEIHYR